MLKSLQARLLAFVVVLLAGAVFAVGVLSYQQLRSQLLDGVERDARSATTGYAFAVATWLDARTAMIASLRPLVGRPDAAEYYARYAEAGGFDRGWIGFERDLDVVGCRPVYAGGGDQCFGGGRVHQ